MRIIEESTRAIADIAALLLAGDFDLALLVVHKTSDAVLGDLGPVFERLEAASVVDLFGKLDLDRVRIYAALLAEEGAIRERSGQMPRAKYCFRRAHDLYEAMSQSGVQLKAADWERLAMLRPKLDS